MINETYQERINQALDFIEAETLALCIFDFFLPGKPLDAIISTLKRSIHHIPFIIMTGDESCETERIARGFGPAFFFVKPFALHDFGCVVKEILNKTESPVSERLWSENHE